MIGLTLISHGRLAEEMKSAMEHVVGPQQAVETIAIFPQDDMEERRNEIIKKIESVDNGEGVVVLTDMFGGTPSNLAISIMDGRKIEVIAGMNLPMLIKLAQVRGTATLNDAVLAAQDAGRKYINVASVLLKKEQV